MRRFILIAALAGCCHPPDPIPKPEAVRFLASDCATPARDPPPLPPIRTVDRVVEGYRAERRGRIYNAEALRACAEHLQAAMDQFAIIFPETEGHH